MYKYVVIELQTMTDGTVASIITSHDSENEAWAKYHAVLSAAAVSKLPCHAASILQSDGYQMDYRAFEHEAE